MYFFKFDRQKGVVLPLVAISLFGILAVAGLAVDSGEVYEDYRRAQTAADAAALAGAFEKFYGRDASIHTSAYTEAGNNGFADNQDGIDVVVHHPPISGMYAGDQFSVEVTVSQPSPTFFLGVLGIDTINYTARAVANGNTANGINCVYVLSPDREKALEVSSDSVLDARCGIWVNSNDSQGSSVESGACVKAGEITIVGGYKEGQVCDADGGPAYECTAAGECPLYGKGKPPALQPVQADDPFSTLQAPMVDRSPGACPPPETCNANACSGKEKDPGGPYEPYTIDGGTATLDAKTYCGGILIKGGANVVLNEGVFTLRGGGLRVEGGGTSATGTNISIYNTCFNACTGFESAKEHFWPLDVNSSATVDFSAPQCNGGASGRECEQPLDGILFMADRDGPVSPEPGAYPSNRIDSSSDAHLSGAVYVRDQHLKFHSNARGERANAILVSKFLEVSSNSAVVINNYSGDNSGSPLKRVTLVE